jgi:hypothetical protein
MITKQQILDKLDKELKENTNTVNDNTKAKACELLEYCIGNYDNAREIAQATSMAALFVYDLLTKIQTRIESEGLGK